MAWAGRMDESAERTLRAKYLDWCSARVAERFLDLSPEEIYVLASPPDAEGGEPSPSLPPSETETYRTLVQRATEALLDEMSLPPFEDWCAAYRDSPGRYDAEMLGFWREVSGGGE
jgi:hypothetical protein